MHENQMGRMIEETMAFEEAVRATTSWIDERQAWSDSLVVIVADHDHLLWGPSSDTEPFQPLHDNGAGKLPGYRWLADEHSNALVRLFARGAGAERFEHAADGEDPFRGRYLHQTDVFHVLEALIGRGGS
jgi:alkaline phosphatase